MTDLAFLGVKRKGATWPSLGPLGTTDEKPKAHKEALAGEARLFAPLMGVADHLGQIAMLGAPAQNLGRFGRA